MEDRARIKTYRAETKVLDDSHIEVVASTEAKDRDGDIIRVAGWDLKNFNTHPVLLSSHDYGSLRSQIGEWTDMKKRGQELVGVAHYYVGEGNEEADWGYKLAQKGRAAFSVGFIPDMSKAKELTGDGWMPSYEFTKQELLEVSQVTIPANPEALQRMKGIKLHPVLAELVAEALDGEPKDIPIEDGADTIRQALAGLMSDEVIERIAEAVAKRLDPAEQYKRRFLAATNGGNHA